MQGYFLGSYSARKLGHEVDRQRRRQPQPDPATIPGADFAGLLQSMGTGLLVTELMGQGVNSVTGDYSRGAAGFWVENGEIAYPVQEITIAGNLKDMFRGIVAVGNDVVAARLAAVRLDPDRAHDHRRRLTSPDGFEAVGACTSGGNLRPSGTPFAFSRAPSTLRPSRFALKSHRIDEPSSDAHVSRSNMNTPLRRAFHDRSKTR